MLNLRRFDRALTNGGVGPEVELECNALKGNFAGFAVPDHNRNRTDAANGVYAGCSRSILFDEVHLNLAYRWFCCFDLNSKMPDHSTFSKYRHDKPTKFTHFAAASHAKPIVIDRWLAKTERLGTVVP